MAAQPSRKSNNRTSRGFRLLFTKGCGHRATVAYATHGFCKTVIQPFDPNIFKKEDFVAADVSDRLLNTDQLPHTTAARDPAAAEESMTTVGPVVIGRPHTAAIDSGATDESAPAISPPGTGAIDLIAADWSVQAIGPPVMGSSASLQPI